MIAKKGVGILTHTFTHNAITQKDIKRHNKLGKPYKIRAFEYTITQRITTLYNSNPSAPATRKALKSLRFQGFFHAQN